MPPGAVNAHTHLYSGLAPLGMPAPTRTPESFVDILRLVWWRLDRALDEASLRTSARLYLAEALLAGTTTLVDHHESPRFIEGSLDVLAEEAEALGTRLVVTYGATERNGGRDEAKRGLAECARFIREGRFPHVKGVVGLHASFTVSDDTIREAGELARELGVPVHVHVAEAASDVEDAKARGYEGPLDRLIALGCLPEGSILAHGVWLDEHQVHRAAQAGAWLVQNPRSNANNKVGYPKGLHASGRVALGTDGFPADMEEEGRVLLEEAAKNGDLASPRALAMRGIGGSRLAGRFFAGTTAGLTSASSTTFGAFFATDGGTVEGVESGWRDDVTKAQGDRPSKVVVDGRTVVDGGRLVTGDLEEIRAHAREQAARLWARMATVED